MNRRFLTSLVVVIAVFPRGPATHASAQAYAAGGFQSNQIGPNSFVSSPTGEVFLLNTHDSADSWDRRLNNPLYHNTGDSGDSWERLASNMKAVALDPQNEKVIYGINTEDHLVKSLDGGKQWLTLNMGFPNLSLSTIYVNPADSQEILVGGANGLFRTTDAGFSWHPTSFVLPVNLIVINPHAPSSRYLLSAGIIFVSTDSGSTWKKSETGLPTELLRGAGRTATKVTARVSLLFYVPWERPFLLAATYGKGVFRSDDGGISWRPTGTGPGLPETFITASIGKQRIVLSSANSLYQSTDGISWKRISINSGKNIPVSFTGVIEYPKREGLLLNFRFPDDGEIVEGGGPRRRLGFLDPKGSLVGLNYGVLLHSEVDHLWAGNINGHPAIFAVTANLDDLDQPGKYRRPTFLSVSTDDGYSWELLGEPVCGGLVASPRSSSTIWVYGKGTCIARSQDGGLTWNVMPGVPPRSSDAPIDRLVLDPIDPNIAYYSVNSSQNRVYRYQYNPATNQGVAVALKSQAREILVDEGNRLSLYTSDGELSTDGGWTFTDKSSSLKRDLGIPGYYNPSLTLISFRNGEIRGVAGHIEDVMSGSGTITVVRSVDLGSTWQKVSAVKTRIPGYGSNPQIFFNENDSSNVFVVSSDSSMARLLETKDGGNTWRELYSRPITRNDFDRYAEVIRAVAQTKDSEGRRLLIGGRYGLWASVDEGATWKGLGGIQ